MSELADFFIILRLVDKTRRDDVFEVFVGKLMFAMNCQREIIDVVYKYKFIY